VTRPTSPTSDVSRPNDRTGFLTLQCAGTSRVPIASHECVPSRVPLKHRARRGRIPLSKKDPHHRRGSKFRPCRGSFPHRSVLSRLWPSDFGLTTCPVPPARSRGQLLCVVNYLLKEGDHTTRPADDILLTLSHSCHAVGSTVADRNGRAPLACPRQDAIAANAEANAPYFHSAINHRFAKIRFRRSTFGGVSSVRVSEGAHEFTGGRVSCRASASLEK
jgi:hypothetical protein